jgi:hypothetical protein
VADGTDQVYLNQHLLGEVTRDGVRQYYEDHDLGKLLKRQIDTRNAATELLPGGVRAIEKFHQVVDRLTFALNNNPVTLLRFTYDRASLGRSPFPQVKSLDIKPLDLALERLTGDQTAAPPPESQFFVSLPDQSALANNATPAKQPSFQLKKAPTGADLFLHHFSISRACQSDSDLTR